MAEQKKINKGLKSPAFNHNELNRNAGGLPPTKTAKTISDECRPPKTSPSGIGGSRSVRT